MSAVGVSGPPVPTGTAGGPVALAWTHRGRPCGAGLGESARRPEDRPVDNDAMSAFVVVSVPGSPGNTDDLGEQ